MLPIANSFNRMNPSSGWTTFHEISFCIEVKFPIADLQLLFIGVIRLTPSKILPYG